MSDTDTIPPSSIIAKASEKLEEFSDLLDKIDYAPSEIKKLWKEIYENAVDDRSYALLLFLDLYRNVSGDPQGHAIHGKLMVQYMDKLNNANEQLLKLSQQVEQAADMDQEIDAEGLYDEINEGKK